LGAADTLLTIARNGLDEPVYRIHRAWLEMAQGDSNSARRIVRDLSRTGSTKDPRVAATLRLMEEWEQASSR
jgi:hypothetical protein